MITIIATIKKTDTMNQNMVRKRYKYKSDILLRKLLFGAKKCIDVCESLENGKYCSGAFAITTEAKSTYFEAQFCNECVLKFIIHIIYTLGYTCTLEGKL